MDTFIKEHILFLIDAACRYCRNNLYKGWIEYGVIFIVFLLGPFYLRYFTKYSSKKWLEKSISAFLLFSGLIILYKSFSSFKSDADVGLVILLIMGLAVGTYLTLFGIFGLKDKS